MSQESAAPAAQSRKWPEAPAPALVLAAHEEFKLLLESLCRWTAATGLERYPGMLRVRDEHLVRLSRCLQAIGRTFWRWHQAFDLPASRELAEALERNNPLDLASRLATSVDAATTALPSGERPAYLAMTLDATNPEFIPAVDAVLALTQGGRAIKQAASRCSTFYEGLKDLERLAAGDLGAAADVVNKLKHHRDLAAAGNDWPLPAVHPEIDDLNDEWFGAQPRVRDAPEVDDLSRVIMRVLLPAGCTVRVAHIAETVAAFASQVQALAESESLVKRRLGHLVRVGFVTKGKLPGYVLTARGAAFARSRQLESLATRSDTAKGPA